MLWVPFTRSMTPGAVSNTPSCVTTHTHTRTKTCLCITSATMTDLQADRGVDTHQGFFKQLTSISSISFWPVGMLVSNICLPCRSDRFHQGVCVTTLLLPRVFICSPSTVETPPLLYPLFSSHIQPPAEFSVHNQFQPLCGETSRVLLAEMQLSALCCHKSGFNGVQAEMLVNMIDYLVCILN